MTEQVSGPQARNSPAGGKENDIDLDLARRLEYREADSIADYAHTQSRIAPDIDPAVVRVGGGLAVFTGARSPVGGVIGLGLSDPVTTLDIDMIEQFFCRRGGEVTIDCCPLADS